MSTQSQKGKAIAAARWTLDTQQVGSDAFNMHFKVQSCGQIRLCPEHYTKHSECLLISLSKGQATLASH